MRAEAEKLKMRDWKLKLKLKVYGAAEAEAAVEAACLILKVERFILLTPTYYSLIVYAINKSANNVKYRLSLSECEGSWRSA